MKKWNKNPNDEYVIKGSKVEVYNNDVNGALRRMKKVLERNNWQKDLAKHEFFEKPSVQRKRRKDAAKKRWQKEVLSAKLAGKWPIKPPADSKFMKSKRKRRRILDAANLFETAQRNKK
jgi:small subunit ribosomal protein S21